MSFRLFFPSPLHRNLLATFNIKRSFPQTNQPTASPAPQGLTGWKLWDPQTWPGFMMPTALFFLKCGIWALLFGGVSLVVGPLFCLGGKLHDDGTVETNFGQPEKKQKNPFYPQFGGKGFFCLNFCCGWLFRPILQKWGSRC